MYYGRKKGIIITVIVVVVILLLGIGGAGAYLFTDLFKTNETLFWKYIGNAFENVQIQENMQMEEIAKLKMQSPYIINGELTAQTESQESNVDDILRNSKITINSEIDKTTNYAYTNLNLECASTSIFDVNYVHDDDIYALKSDEIATAYIGIRNDNLSELMQKLSEANIEINTDIDKIPSVDIYSLLDISEEEKSNIIDTYVSVIKENISKENYSKQTGAVIAINGVSYNSTSYRVDLSSAEISNIVINILNTLKTDSTTLNLMATKAKELNLDEEYTTISGLNETIDNLIKEASTIEFKDTSFVVYAYNGEAIATEIIEKNNVKATIYTTNIDNQQKINIILENLGSEEEFNIITAEIVIENKSTTSTQSITINVDDTEYYLNIENIGSATQKNLNTNIEIGVTSEELTGNIQYTQTTEFVSSLENIENLDNTNCAILNDYSTENLNTLIPALEQQILIVTLNKAQMLGLINIPVTVEE
jgi:hypothetical protein